jgi:AraC family transcriptional regulator, melibiose operon regulatory protein
MNSKDTWLYTQLDGYYVQNFNHFKMDYHQHQRLEIMLVITGHCHVALNVGNQHEVKLLKSGDYIVIAPNIRHLLDIEKGSYCRLICVEFGISPKNSQRIRYSRNSVVSLSEGFSHYVEKLPAFVFLKDNGNLCQTLLHLIQEKSKNANSVDHDLLLDTLVLQAMAILGRDYLSHSNQPDSLSYVKKAINYLDTHFEEDLLFNDVAQECNINLAYLQRLFKQHTNRTMTDYIIDKRLEKAKILLSNTNISITDICFLVGFNHRQYFTKQFTHRIGLSPKHYRTSYQNVHTLTEVNRFN